MRAAANVRCLSWDPQSERMAQIARELEIPLETIHYLAYRRPSIAPLKYILQTAATLRSLARDWPDVVIVQSPPPFAPLAVALARWLRPAMRFVVDCHTGPFLEPKWQWLQPLSRFVSRQAALTLVSNDELRERVESWGAAAYVLSNPLPDLPRPTRRHPVDAASFNVVAICSFYEDEPIDELLRVRDLPRDVRLWVTGDSRRAPHRVIRRLSDRVTLCGFLDAGDYASLLGQADAALVLCTRPQTMLQGAVEAAALGKPLVTSESTVMRRTFTKGTVWVENTTASIEAGIREAQREHARLAREMAELATELRARFHEEFAELVRRVDAMAYDQCTTSTPTAAGGDGGPVDVVVPVASSNAPASGAFPE